MTSKGDAGYDLLAGRLLLPALHGALLARAPRPNRREWWTGRIPLWRSFQKAREQWMLEFAKTVTQTIKQTRPVSVYQQFGPALRPLAGRRFAGTK